MRKIFFLIALSLVLLIPLRGNALSQEEILLKIRELQRELIILQEKLRILTDQPIDPSFIFSNDLKEGDRNQDIKNLQILLNKNSTTRVIESGLGSPGNETDFFGPLTRSAVIRFQELYFKEILDPWGFKRGTGIVGPTTRSKLNELSFDQSLDLIQFSVSNYNPLQGDVVLVTVKNIDQNEEVSINFRGKKIDLYSIGYFGDKSAILAIGSKLVPGNYPLTINSNQKLPFSTIIRVGERKFPITELRITPELKEKGYTPETIQDNMVKENSSIFSAVLNAPIHPFYFNKSFVNPLDVMIDVGNYGNIRKSGNASLQHLGVDLNASEGTPVYSINEGIVKFTREMDNYGKTIIVDHGGGIRSLYLHMSEYSVNEGDVIEGGSIVGLSGNTGYSIAPHLHLTISVHGESIDPLRFLKLLSKNI